MDNKHYENLSKLYLRLKGYITTNIILHSENKGQNKSELDILSIRMPFHKQEQRQVKSFDYLESSKSKIEIIIADVKAVDKLENIKFNDGLRKQNNVIKQLVEWIGIYEEISEEIIENFKVHLNKHHEKNNNYVIISDEKIFNGLDIKFTFFCPKLDEFKNEKGYKYIHGKEIFNFIWECLNLTEDIPTCSRTYDYALWNEFKIYINYFKNNINLENVNIETFEAYINKLNIKKIR